MGFKARKPRRRHLGGVTFTCARPGLWVSEDTTLVIVHVMSGTVWDSWELYQTRLREDEWNPEHCDDWALDGSFNPMAVFLEGHFTMGELDDAVAEHKDIGHADIEDWCREMVEERKQEDARPH